MVDDYDELFTFIKAKHQEARDGSETIVFRKEAIALSARGGFNESNNIRSQAPSITDIPAYKVLEHATGQSAWAAVLAVDMRQSTRMAKKLGAELTYITMHTFLPTMARLIEKAGGKVIGLRGDGLFGAFGVTEISGDDEVFTSEIAGAAVQSAVNSGKAMLEAVDDIINPVLNADDIAADIAIGVGIDYGDIVITRIGFESASEVTAYGAAVNNACKRFASGRNTINISNRAWEVYPSTKGGRVTARQFDGGYEINYPFNVIGGR